LLAPFLQIVIEEVICHVEALGKVATHQGGRNALLSQQATCNPWTS
jgi:hypothetical protein